MSSSYLLVVVPLNSQAGLSALELPAAQPGDKVASAIVLIPTSGFSQWQDITNLFNSELVQKVTTPTKIMNMGPTGGDGIPFILQAQSSIDMSNLTVLLLMNRP